jgi:hypothetical protein
VKIFSNKIRRPKPKPKVKKIWLRPKALVISHSLVPKYTQYPFIRNGDKVPLVGFLKNSPISDSQRFLIIQV